MTYSFRTILINGREVEISDILQEKAIPQSSFEVSLFAFIQKWHGPSDSFVQHTSGSTGPPRPIVITRQQMTASARLTQAALGLRAGETALVCLDPEFIAGKMMIVRSFIADMRIVAVTPTANPLKERHLLNLPIDFTALVPLQLSEILLSGQRGVLDEVRNVIVGGAAPSEDLKESVLKLRANVFATYGMTETVSHIALQPLNGRAASEYYAALPGIKISCDSKGCLEIMAPYLSEKIITRDVVEIRNDVQFKWIGRLDNVINSGGIKIAPEIIEAKLSKLFTQLKIENRFLISSRPDPALGNRLILLVEGTLTMPAEQIKSHFKEVLHAYEIPKEIYDNIPFVLTKNGKINRFETARKIGTS